MLENGGTPGDAHSIVQAMKDQSFNGASGLVSLDDRGDRALDVEFLNVLDADVWPAVAHYDVCLLYTSPSPRDKRQSRMPSSA